MKTTIYILGLSLSWLPFQSNAREPASPACVKQVESFLTDFNEGIQQELDDDLIKEIPEDLRMLRLPNPPEKGYTESELLDAYRMERNKIKKYFLSKGAGWIVVRKVWLFSEDKSGLNKSNACANFRYKSLHDRYSEIVMSFAPTSDVVTSQPLQLHQTAPAFKAPIVPAGTAPAPALATD
jgi:hypothetical protein